MSNLHVKNDVTGWEKVQEVALLRRVNSVAKCVESDQTVWLARRLHMITR
jgi:hypothetical protein